jgi:hypothetical protein
MFRYGSSIDSLPLPEVDFPAFTKGLEALNSKNKKIWCAGERTLRDWVDVNALRRSYGSNGKGGGGGCTIM